MNKIKFNNVEFEVDSYNKSTYFSGETMNSTASCTLVSADAEALNALAENKITSIQIKHDNEVIYNLSNLNASISNINEYLSMDKMSITVNLTFDKVNNEVV